MKICVCFYEKNIYVQNELWTVCDIKVLLSGDNVFTSIMSCHM